MSEHTYTHTHTHTVFTISKSKEAIITLEIKRRKNSPCSKENIELLPVIEDGMNRVVLSHEIIYVRFLLLKEFSRLIMR